MGREVRRVPANWEHPKDDKGYIPMYDNDFDTALAEWLKGYELWKQGKHPEQQGGIDKSKYAYWEWEGGPPNPESYRPKFEGVADWYQVYETVTEGTPVTPPFATETELIDYLVKYGDFWDQKRGEGGWNRETAKRFVKAAWSPSMAIIDGQIKMPRDGI